MKKIAITGNIASGKSLLENILKNLNFKVLDTDEVVQNLYKNSNEVYKKIVDLFPNNDIFDEQNKLSSKKIAKIVYNDRLMIKKLEDIFHPIVKIEIEKFFHENNNEKLLFVSVPQLYEAKMEGIFDTVILITANEQTRINRLISTRNLTENEAKLRIQAQIPQEQKEKLVDFTLDNNSDVSSFEKKVNLLLQKL